MNNLKNIFIWVLCIALASFFMYKGISKHWLKPCKVYPADTTVPAEYINVITALCQSGFLKFVAFFQVLAGALLLFPKTRVVGTFLLLAIITNIFFIHFFMDNRPEELVESGIPLLANLLLVALLFERWRKVF